MARARRRSTPRRAAAGAPPSLRVIGGEWRSRKLTVADRPGLRPTPNRVRETLFNWLAPRLPGARCADLFAGTGALGIEALSRGAGHVTFAETDRAAADAIETALATFGAGDRAYLSRDDALRVATRLSGLDIVFIDPPFAGDALQHDALTAIAPALATQARVYLEYPADRAEAVKRQLAADYTVLRDGRAGEVGYCLVTPCDDAG